MEDVVKDIIGKKASANNLDNYRPNLLMVNFLLGPEWQTAKSLGRKPTVELGKTLDGVLFTACGIDEIPTWRDSFVYTPDENHPINKIKNNNHPPSLVE